MEKRDVDNEQRQILVITFFRLSNVDSKIIRRLSAGRRAKWVTFSLGMLYGTVQTQETRINISRTRLSKRIHASAAAKVIWIPDAAACPFFSMLQFLESWLYVDKILCMLTAKIHRRANS